MDPEENRNLKSDLLVENMRLQSKSEALAENTVQNVQPESVVEKDDEAPPLLLAEKPTPATMSPQTIIKNKRTVRCQTPGGTEKLVTISLKADGTELYLDEDGEEVEMIDDMSDRLRTVEFNFLDNKNLSCGVCGEIVSYDSLMNAHIPQCHPEILGGSDRLTMEEVSYESWLKGKLCAEKKNIEYGREINTSAAVALRLISARKVRKVSQYRVNPIEMDLEQLDLLLQKKMMEKMGRKVPVTLLDKKHAKCGLCNAVISLNRKFEVVHLVRHFNAWHPTGHRCAGQWQHRATQPRRGKPLSIQDFAVIDVNVNSPGNFQCIWCGDFMSKSSLAAHFTESHPDEVEVPKCHLCLQELFINARLLEKFGEDFEATLLDERRIKCDKFIQEYLSEAALDEAISKRMKSINASDVNAQTADDDEPSGEREEQRNIENPQRITNSKMDLGRHCKPKRSFVQPKFRQAVPVNSDYVEAVTECHWKCKLCAGNIYGAVISAGAIRHYKQEHPSEVENLQYELCKARLDRVSGGCMEFVHPQLLECLICNLTYALHKPYNMCRGIRHLKLRHPELMPESVLVSSESRTPRVKRSAQDDIQIGETINDGDILARFRNEYPIDFESIQVVYSKNMDPVYVLLGTGENLDLRTARQIIRSLGVNEKDTSPEETVVVKQEFKTADAKESISKTSMEEKSPKLENKC